MKMSEFRDRLYAANYSTHFQEKSFNKPDKSLFERASLGYEWNYGSYVNLLPKNASVLDVGCGIGQCLYWLDKRGFKAVGVDGSVEQLEQARKILADEGRLEHADAFEFLKDNTNKFEAVIANDLIEHFTRTEALDFSDAVYNTLKPGGIFIVKVPNAICPSAGHFFDNITHERPYTDISIKQLLRVAGFEEMNVFSFEHPPFRNVLSMAAWLVRRITWSLYRARLFIHDFSPGTKVVGKQLYAIAKKPEN